MARRKKSPKRAPTVKTKPRSSSTKTPRRTGVLSNSRNRKPAVQHPISPGPSSRKPSVQRKTKKTPPSSQVKSKASAKATREKRSQAARKGWATRRKKQVQALEAELVRRKQLHEQYVQRQARSRPQVEADLERERELIRKQGEREAAELKEDAEEVLARAQEQYEEARQLKITERVKIREAEKQTTILTIQAQVMERMFAAEQEGQLDDMSFELADEFGYDRKEIYAMYHGYTPNYLPPPMEALSF